PGAEAAPTRHRWRPRLPVHVRADRPGAAAAAVHRVPVLPGQQPGRVPARVLAGQLPAGDEPYARRVGVKHDLLRRRVAGDHHRRLRAARLPGGPAQQRGEQLPGHGLDAALHHAGSSDRHRPGDRVQLSSARADRHDDSDDHHAGDPTDAVHDPVGHRHVDAPADVDGRGGTQPGRLEAQGLLADHRADDVRRCGLGRSAELRGDRHRDVRGDHPLQQPDHHADHVRLRRHHPRQLRAGLRVLRDPHRAHRCAAGCVPEVHQGGGRQDVTPPPAPQDRRPPVQRPHPTDTTTTHPDDEEYPHMRRSKTLAAGGLLVAAALALAACNGGGGGNDENHLVLYSSMTDNDLNVFTDIVTAEFPDIDIEIVNGSAGELTTRTQSEAGNPQGDMMWGGLDTADGDRYSDIFEHWLSDYEDDLLPEYRSPNGFYNVDHLSTVAFAVNTDI